MVYVRSGVFAPQGLPHNTHPCTKALSLWMVSAPRAPPSTPKHPSLHAKCPSMDVVDLKLHESKPQKTHLCTKIVSQLIGVHPKVNEYPPQKTHLCTITVS